MRSAVRHQRESTSASGGEASPLVGTARRRRSQSDSMSNHAGLRQRRTQTSAPVQGELRAAPQKPASEVVETAAGGVTGATPQRYPNADRLSPLFGHWAPYLSRLQAYSSPDACADIGARAYMTTVGGVQRAAFPDASRVSLGTSAHEAIHGLEQMLGMHVSGGVSRPGDRYEQAASKGAALVERNSSIESFLDGHLGTSSAGRQTNAQERRTQGDDIQVRGEDGGTFPLSNLNLSQQQYEAVRGYVQRQEGAVQREPVSLTVLGLALSAVGLIQAGVTSSPSGLTLTYDKVAWPSAPSFATGMEERMRDIAEVRSSIPVSYGGTVVRMRGRFGQGKVEDNEGNEHSVPICTNVWFDVRESTEWSMTYLAVTITHQTSALGTTEDPQIEFIVNVDFDPTGWGDVYATGLVNLHIVNGYMECTELRFTQGGEDVASQARYQTLGFKFTVGPH